MGSWIFLSPPICTYHKEIKSLCFLLSTGQMLSKKVVLKQQDLSKFQTVLKINKSRVMGSWIFLNPLCTYHKGIKKPLFSLVYRSDAFQKGCAETKLTFQSFRQSWKWLNLGSWAPGSLLSSYAQLHIYHKGIKKPLFSLVYRSDAFQKGCAETKLTFQSFRQSWKRLNLGSWAPGSSLTP